MVLKGNRFFLPGFIDYLVTFGGFTRFNWLKQYVVSWNLAFSHFRPNSSCETIILAILAYILALTPLIFCILF